MSSIIQPPGPVPPVQIVDDKEKDQRKVDGRVTYLYPEMSASEVGRYYSGDVVIVNGFEWWIELGKEKSQLTDQDCLSFWIKCRPCESTMEGWNCYAEMEFRLLSQPLDQDNIIVWNLNDVLTDESNCVGFYDFEDWKSMRDTRKGFCRKDTIRVEVIVREMHSFVVVPEVPVFNCTTDEGWAGVYRLKKTFKQLVLPHNDVTITFGKNKFYAHSDFVSKCMRLRKMLLDQKPRSEKRKKIRIQLPDDTHVDAFLSIMSYLYTGRLLVPNDKAFLVDLVITANSLSIPAILKTCVPQVSPARILTVISLAVKEGNEELLEDCFPILCEKTDKALYSQQFLKIHKDVLKRILVQEKLKCDELDLFLRSMDWADEECKREGLAVNSENRRSALGDSLFNIRFPCMSEKEFKQVRKTYAGLLTEDEVDQIQKFIKKKKGGKDLRFPTTPRHRE